MGEYAVVCTYDIWSIPSSVGGYLCHFHLSAVGNNAAVNVGVQVSLRVLAFGSLGLDSEVEILGHIVILLEFVEQPCYLPWHTILHSYRPFTDIPISPHPWPHLLSSGLG